MKDYAFYSSLVIQFIVTILVFAGIGWYVDKKFPTAAPYGTLTFSLIGIGGSMYLFIRQIINKSKKK